MLEAALAEFTVIVAVPRICLWGQLQMPPAGQAQVPLVSVAVYLPGEIYVCETIPSELQLEHTGTKPRFPLVPSPKFTVLPMVLPCGADEVNCTESGAAPDVGEAEKFVLVLFVETGHTKAQSGPVGPT